MVKIHTLLCCPTRVSAVTVNFATDRSFTLDLLSLLLIVSSAGMSPPQPMRSLSAPTTRSKRPATRKRTSWSRSHATRATKSPQDKLSTMFAFWRRLRISSLTSTSGRSVSPTTCHHQTMELMTETAPLPDGVIPDVSKTIFSESGLKKLEFWNSPCYNP